MRTKTEYGSRTILLQEDGQVKVRIEPAYKILASTIQARLNCIDSVNTLWEEKHSATIKWFEKNLLPSGSGIDSGCTIDLTRSHDENIVINTSYHHMNENRFYDGWTEHTVTIRPAFDGLNIRISGRDRNQIKDYLHDTFDGALNTMVAQDATSLTALLNVDQFVTAWLNG